MSFWQWVMAVGGGGALLIGVYLLNPLFSDWADGLKYPVEDSEGFED